MGILVLPKDHLFLLITDAMLDGLPAIKVTSLCGFAVEMSIALDQSGRAHHFQLLAYRY